MPVRPNFNPDYLYFVTTTAAKHIHIFKRESLTRIILDSLHFLRTSKRMELFVFVIMPNHISFDRQVQQGTFPFRCHARFQATHRTADHSSIDGGRAHRKAGDIAEFESR